MKPSDIKALLPEEAMNRLSELREEHARLRLQLVTKQLANPLRVRLIRRDIARLETILGEQRRGLNPFAQAAEAGAE